MTSEKGLTSLQRPPIIWLLQQKDVEVEDEHEGGQGLFHPAGCTPLLVLDVFEHAFMIDYGLKRADYIEAFFKNINWGVVESRLR